MSYLTELGFRASQYDSGLFISTTKPHLYLTTHVDDFKIVAQHEDDAHNTLDALKARFEIKDLGQIKHYLGTAIETDDKGIRITQSSYIDELVESFGMTDSHATKSPLDPGIIIDDEPNLTIPTREY
jgi:hypothetical protein